MVHGCIASRCLPVDEEGSPFALQAMGDRCRRFLKYGKALEYYRRALPGIRAIQDASITRVLESENSRRLIARPPLPPLTREPDWEHTARDLENTIHQVDDAVNGR